jgi:dimethylargininase
VTTQRRALIRPPSPHLADGLLTHLDRVPVDADLAMKQWAGYTRALTDAGWDTVEVPAAPDCPDGVFVEDTIVMIGGTAVITRPGADERKPETVGTSVTVRALGYPTAAIEQGTLDGGDVLKIDNTVYVGRTQRTSADGIAAFRRICDPLGHRVVAVPTTKVLHLKSAVTALPDGTVIGYEPLVDDPGFWPHFRPMPEEGGSHVVDLGDGRLLMAASAPRSAELIADLGYTPIPVDISEFEKLEGCVTCLSVRLRDVPRGES